MTIDGASLSATCRALQLEIDFRRLLTLFQNPAHLVRALYFTTISEESSLQRLMDWLDYNGYSTVTMPTRDYTDEHGHRRIRGSIDVRLAVDALRLVPAVDHVVLFSGKSEFWPLVAALQEHGKRVTVVSSLKTSPPSVSDALRRQADEFVDLLDLEPEIARSTAGVEP